MQLENKNSLRQQLVQLEKTLYLKHKFALIVAIFNHYPYRDKLIRKINRIFKNNKNMEITRESCPDFETFEEQLASFSKAYDLIHMVNNGERLYKDTIPLFYKGLNYHRDAIAKENPVSIILWMLPEDVEDFAANAADMWSWHGGIFDFEIPVESHEDTNSFPFIRLTPQEREKKQKRITEILDYFKSNPDLDDPLKALLQQELAQLYYELSDYIDAEAYTLETLELHRKRGNVEQMYCIYNLLQVIYRDMGENGEALHAAAARILLKESSSIDDYSFNQGEFSEQKALEAKKRLTEYKEELENAARIQKSILPNQFPPYLYADMRPAREVGGDFYDYTVIDKNRVAFFIGDVEGKGLSTASLAAKCSSILKTLAELDKHPGECLRTLNERLIDERDEEAREAALSVSIFYGVLDLASGAIEYSRAGKIAFTYIIFKDGAIRQLKDVGGFPLGFFGNIDYDYRKTRLNKGDMICICMDGLSDTLDIEGESFGGHEDRIYACLQKVTGMSAKNAVENFLKDIDNIIGNAFRTEDITVLTLKYDG